MGNFDDGNLMVNNNQQPVLPMSYQNYASPYTKLRKTQEMNLIQQQQQQLNKLSQDRLSNSVASVNSAGESPQLSPVFKSEAAKQIIKEMTEKKIDGPRKRLIPREKRRHYTVSSCKPIIGLEDLLSKMVLFIFLFYCLVLYSFIDLFILFIFFFLIHIYIFFLLGICLKILN